MPDNLVCRFGLLAIVCVLLVSFLPDAPIGATGTSVTWANLVNVTVNGTVLQKTGGCDGCDDAGATSVEELTAGDGYVEFRVGEMGTIWVAGLSHGNNGTSYGDIDFAFSFNGRGSAEMRENGIYQSETAYVPADSFRVAIVGGRVQYSRNGTLLRESEKLPEYPLLLDATLLTAGATIHDATLGETDPPPSGEGVLEKSGSPARRARFPRAQIEAFLPADGAKGAFTFPAPYNTRGVRLTNRNDCADGQDCLWYVGYSYWRNINNHVASRDMYIFLGMDTNRGGGGPTLLRYNKTTDTVQNLGPLFGPQSPYRSSTGEGWYFSGTRPTRLYTHLVGSGQLRRYDILTRRFESTPALDLSRCPRPGVCPADAAYIVQPHSSDNDIVHSASVQNGAWQRTGCVVYQADVRRFEYHAPPAGYALDECHVDKSGRWLAILETKSDGARINRIVDLRTRAITTMQDVNGAPGHLDMGFGYAVGADSYSPLPNATFLLKFPVLSTERPIGPVLHFNKRWDLAAANHVAHGNANPRERPESQYACGSNASRVADMADEIICFPLNASRNADGSLDVLAVAQVMTDLDAAGGRDDDHDDYEQVPKGNLDVTGRYFLWTTNLGGDRLDAVLVKIPVERLIPPPPASLRTTRRR